MKKNLKILIVGFGSIGKRHFENLKKLGYDDFVIVDVDKKSELISESIFYRDYKKAIVSEKPNIVLVCTPPSSHVQIAKFACDNGCDVFIEKPVSNNLRGIESLEACARRKKVILAVASNWQFRESFTKLNNLIKNKTLGKIIGGRVNVSYFLPEARGGVNYKKTYAGKAGEGGVVLDTGSHVLPYLIILFGDLEKVNVVKSKLHLIGIDAEEAAQITCKFKSGVIISVWMDYVSKYTSHILDLVFGSGILNVDMRQNKISLINNKSKKEIFSANSDLNKMFVDELKYFLDCVSLRKKPSYGVSEAKKDLRFLLSIN